MANSSELSSQLASFGKAQLTDLAPRDISKSTIHLILTTAFFTGAVINLSKPLHATKKTYLDALTHFLAGNFGLGLENAKGSVESNARLYKRYVLIEKCFNHGWASAQSWGKGEPNTEDALKVLINKYRNLSMSNLSIEGVKEEKVAPPPEIEAIAHPEPAPLAKHAPTKPRRRVGLIIFWLTVSTLAAIVAYFGLHPEQIPHELSTFFQHTLARIKEAGFAF